MTTNHYTKLPKVLVRPGRVDLSVYIGVASKSQMRQMFLRFFIGEEEMADQFAATAEGEVFSMAELQGFFMFFKNKPEQAVANVGPYLQSRREAFHEAHSPPSQPESPPSQPESATPGLESAEAQPPTQATSKVE